MKWWLSSAKDPVYGVYRVPLHRDDDDDDVDGVRLRLRTSATNGPIFRPLDDITGENPGNPTSTIITSETGGTGEGKDEFCFTKYLFHTSKGSLTCCKILRHGADGLLSL
jgi:hypothetical protein